MGENELAALARRGVMGRIAVGWPVVLFRSTQGIYAPMTMRRRWQGIAVEPAQRALFAEIVMSCWVVPTVAAELWGVTLEHVMNLIQEGKVPFKDDCQFLVVDVAPHSETQPAASKRNRDRSATFVPAPNIPAAVLEPEEIEALASNWSDGIAVYEQETSTPSTDDIASDADGEESSWVRVRQIVGRRRKAPAA